MNVLVLGVGNILLSDESVGVRAVEMLAERYAFPSAVELLDGGTAGMELLECIARRDLVIIADAVKSGQAPGTVVRIAGDEVPAFFRTRISPHQLGISEILATLRITDETPGEVVIIGVEPQSLATSLEMTPPVAAALPRLVQGVIDELHAHGLSVAERRPAA